LGWQAACPKEVKMLQSPALLPHASLPLSRFAVFHTSDVDQAREEVAKIYCPHRLVPTGTGGTLNARHHTIDLGGYSLNYVQYGSEVRIVPGQLQSFFLLQLPLTGQARISCGRQNVESSPRRATLLSPSLDVSMDWSDGCGKLMAQIPRQAVERTLQAMLGREIKAPIEFDAAFDVDHGPGRRIAHMLHLLREDAECDSAVIRAGLGGPHMREILIMALLQAVPNTYSDAIRAPAPGIAPGHVRRAEAFMRAMAAQHLTLCDIAASAGVSTRALQEGFRNFRNTTPLEALRGIRLEMARKALMAAGPGDSVTTVALACGFTHLSRFSISYFERFKELPSETLRGQRRLLI
jgi:AraC-like DNA-binding protein